MATSNSSDSSPEDHSSEQVIIVERPAPKPTVRSPAPRSKKPWLLALGAAVLLALGFGAWRWWQTRQVESSPQVQAASVRLAAVETSIVQEASEFVGNLESSRSVTLRPETQGRVSRILVTEGTRVAVGTPLVELDAEEQTAQVTGSQAAVTAARAARNNATAQLQSARAEQGSAAAEVALQEEQYRRTSSLVAQGVLAQQQLDVVERDRAAAVSQLNAANEQIRAAQAGVAEAQAAIAQAQANVAAASSQLSNATIVASTAGIVGDISVRVGDVVTPSDTVTTITQNDSLDLNLNIPAERRANLRTGLAVELMDIQGNRLTTGRISFVSPQVNNEVQSILAKATFSNPRGQLRDGLNVRARVIWNQSPGILVPTTAITRQAGQAFVYVARQPPATESGTPASLVVQQIPVQVGEIQNNQYPVLKGLQAGDRVVTSGTQSLTNGAPIQPLSEGQTNPAIPAN
jgi:RND family efflux transporter MFP subunit